jgi:hypothetical protein
MPVQDQIQFASELMKNQVPATVVTPNQAMASVADQAGEAMLFSIGNDGVLRVVLRSDDSASGWARYDLTSAIGEGQFAEDSRVIKGPFKAVTFAVGQLSTGKILLGVVMQSASEPKVYRLFIAGPFSNDATVTNWADVGKAWQKRRHPDGDVTITGLRMGAGTEDKFPIGVADVRGANNADEQWLFNADPRDTLWGWTPFELPTNATGKLFLTTGMIDGIRGAYALFDTSTGQCLEFTGLPSEDYHRSAHRAFKLPARINAITVVPSAGGSSDLYAAGAGIYVFPGSREQSSTIATSRQVAEVHEVAVTQDPTTVCIFAGAGDGLVFHCEGTGADTGKWGTPLQILSGVTRIAPARNTWRATNQIFAAKGKNELVYLYQDPDSTLWKETDIRLPEIDRLAEFMTFTTHVRVSDASGNPLINKKVEVTADTWTYVFLNGALHAIDRSQPLQVTTDLTGELTIITEATDISAPMIHLRVEGIDGVRDIEPADKIKRKLAEVKDFADEKLQDGQSLLDERQKKDTGTLNNVRDGMQTLLAGPGKQMWRDQATPLAVGSEDVVWGMSLVDGKVLFREHRTSVLHTTQTADAAALALSIPGPDDWIKAIKVKAGDCLRWMYEKFEEGVKFFWRLAGDAFEFLVEVAGQAFKFLVKGLETALKVVGWLLEKALGIDIEKLCKWLGFIFDWPDILQTKDVIVGLVDRVLDDCKAAITHFEPKVADYFKNLKKMAGELDSLPGLDQQQIGATARTTDKVPVATRNQVQQIDTSPGASWGRYHFMHSGAMAVAELAPVKVSDPLSALMTNVIAPALEKAQADVEALSSRLQKLSGEQSLTAKRFVDDLISGATRGLLDLLETIVTGLVKFAAEIVDLIHGMLTDPIRIPFFSAFYKEHISGGKDLTILDLMALLVAIPSAIAFKLVSGKAPFPAAGKSAAEVVNDLAKVFAVLRQPAPRTDSLAAMQVTPDQLGASSEEDDKIYSHVGGFIYSITTLLDDVVCVAGLTFDAARMDPEAALELKPLLPQLSNEPPVSERGIWAQFCDKIGGFADRVRFGLAVVKFASSFPVGTQPQVNLQRGVWAMTFAGTLGDALIPMLLTEKYKVSSKSRAKAACKAISASVIIIMECIVFGAYECKQGPKGPNGDQIMKLLQNISYFLTEGGIIGFALAPPAEKGYCAILALLPAGFAAIMNAIRCILNIKGSVEHVNY